MRWLVAAFVAALITIAWLVVETRDLAQLVGEHELAARAAERAAAAAEQRAERAERTEAPVPRGPAAPEPGPRSEPAGATAAPTNAQDPVVHAGLALELHTTKQQLAAVTALLEQHRDVARQRAAAGLEAASRAAGTMPEGVRQCLSALHGVLRAEGFTGPRFLRATAVSQAGLEHVEMLDIGVDGLDVLFLQAERMTASVDRATGDLELRFFTGLRTEGGQRTPLPEEGHAVVFRGVDARAVESTLPYLVQAHGAYPAPAEAITARPTDVDAMTRRTWLARFDRVLPLAGTQPTWRVNRFRGMRDGWFLDAELVGVDARNHVVAGAHCERFAVEVDPASGTVSLCLRDGVLRRDGVQSTITGEGFRMLCSALTVQQATDAMLGMVVTK